MLGSGAFGLDAATRCRTTFPADAEGAETLVLLLECDPRALSTLGEDAAAGPDQLTLQSFLQQVRCHSAPPLFRCIAAYARGPAQLPRHPGVGAAAKARTAERRLEKPLRLRARPEGPCPLCRCWPSSTPTSCCTSTMPWPCTPFSPRVGAWRSAPPCARVCLETDQQGSVGVMALIVRLRV